MDPHIVDLARLLLDGEINVDAREPVRDALPVGSGIVGDYAVTVFADFTADCDAVCTVVLRRVGTRWQPIGGSGGSSSGRQSPRMAGRIRRWADRSADGPNWPTGFGPLIAGAGGATLVRSGLWPWSGRYLSYQTLRCAASIITLLVDGQPMAIPWHGRVVIAWESGSRIERIGCDGLSVGQRRRQPDIVGITAGGAQLRPSEPRSKRRPGRRGSGQASYRPLPPG